MIIGTIGIDGNRWESNKNNIWLSVAEKQKKQLLVCGWETLGSSLAPHLIGHIYSSLAPSPLDRLRDTTVMWPKFPTKITMAWQWAKWSKWSKYIKVIQQRFDFPTKTIISRGSSHLKCPFILGIFPVDWSLGVIHPDWTNVRLICLVLINQDAILMNGYYWILIWVEYV